MNNLHSRLLKLLYTISLFTLEASIHYKQIMDSMYVVSCEPRGNCNRLSQRVAAPSGSAPDAAGHASRWCSLHTAARQRPAAHGPCHPSLARRPARSQSKTRRGMQFFLNPRPWAAFYSVERVGGGGEGPSDPSRSAPDIVRASQKKNRACCTQREKADGTQF